MTVRRSAFSRRASAPGGRSRLEPLLLVLLSLLPLLALSNLRCTLAGRPFEPPVAAAAPATPPPPARGAIPAMFVFGDSYSDTGNSAFFTQQQNERKGKTQRLSCSDPYGMTALRHSCRWSDGKLVVDLLAEKLGLPYAVPSEDKAKLEAAAASGSSISFALADSGVTFDVDLSPTKVVNFSSQVDDFLRLNVSADVTKDALFYVAMGSNDVKNWLNLSDNLDSIAMSLIVPLSQQVDGLLPKDKTKVAQIIAGIADGIKRLYAAGARRFLIASVPALGCLPSAISLAGQLNADDRTCLPYLTRIARAMSVELKSTMAAMGAKLPGSVVITADITTAMEDMFTNPGEYGLSTSKWSCCNGAGEFVMCGSTIMDVEAYDVCDDVSKHMFWDGLHTTQAANAILAEKIWSGDGAFISPSNLRELSEQNLK